MTLTLTDRTITLSEDEIANFVTDLSEFSSEIDRIFRQCNDEPDQQQVQQLLKKLSLLAEVYS